MVLSRITPNSGTKKWVVITWYYDVQITVYTVLSKRLWARRCRTINTIVSYNVFVCHRCVSSAQARRDEVVTPLFVHDGNRQHVP